jgi:hypothetical protein
MQTIDLPDFAVSYEVLLGSVIFEAPSCLQYTNFLELNEDLGRRHLDGLYIAETQTIPEVRLHRLPQGTRLAVWTDEDFIAYLDDRVLADQVRPYWQPNDIKTAIEQNTKLVDISEEALLSARFGLRTWGHWLGELLPKIVCAETAYPRRFRYIVPGSVVRDTNLRTIGQSLEAYGIGPDRLIFVEGGSTYRFANLFAVSPVVAPRCAIHPLAVGLMRRIIREDCAGELSKKRIALLRRESSTRNITNIDELSSYLRLRDWTIIDLAMLDFREQVNVFAGSCQLLSVLGSGLTGTIYAPQGIDVITLAPSNWSDRFFFSLMQERRVRLADVRGLSVADNNADPRICPFGVEVVDIEKALKALAVSPAAAKDPRMGPSLTAERARGGTLVFGTSFAPEPQTWSFRHRRWLDAIKSSGLAYTQILLVDDGSPSLPDWVDTTVLHEGAPIPRDQPIILYHFADRLGRPSRYDYPGWHRSFSFAARYAEEAGFDKVIHLETDAFLVSRRAVEYFNSASSGWTAMWAPRHGFAESAIQIIGTDALGSFFAFSRRNYEEFRGREIECFLPLTKIEKGLRGDRYGEYLDYVPQDADYTVQVGTNPSYFWWLDRNERAEDHMPEYAKQLNLDAPLNHHGISYLDFLSILHQSLVPRTYLEIGTDSGQSLLRMKCDALCIDPSFQIADNVLFGRRRTFFFQMTSSEFFRHYDLRTFFAGGVDIAFQDGLHHFEQLLLDFINTERFCHRNSLMVLHDCLPLNERMAERRFRLDETEDPAIRAHWTGDVWRIIPILKQFRPDLRIFFTDCPPTGLVLCANLNPYSTVLSDNYDHIVEHFRELSLSAVGLPALWGAFPMLDSAAIARKPASLTAVLGLD